MIALFALSISAWAAQVETGYFWYETNAGNATLIRLPGAYDYYSYDNVTGAIVIPGTINDGVSNYTVKTIGNQAFVSCAEITHVIVEENVTDIDDYAFWYSGVQTVTLPSTIQRLGTQAFSDAALTSITINAATPPTYGNYLFDGCPLAHIYVPAESVNDYKFASGWSNHASIIEAIPAVTTTHITWQSDEVAYVSMNCSELNVPKNEPGISGISASMIITNTNSNYCQFVSRELWIHNSCGELTFESTVGDISSIVIRVSQVIYPAPSSLSAGWTFDDVAQTLTWTGTASNTVTLSGSLDLRVFAIDFTVVSGSAPVVPTPSGNTITWGGRQAKHLELNPGTVDSQTSPVIKDIITSLSKSATGSCYFNNGNITISNNGILTFRSLVGEISGIDIIGSNVVSATNLSAGWTYDGTSTLTWAGTAAEQVTLSGNIDVINISSIVFTYNPATTSRLGEYFYDDNAVKYEITGTHTAKLVEKNIIGTLDIPASWEDGGVTYYITEIADNAFENNDELSNVSRGENISRIGANAFKGCIRMTDFNLYSEVLDAIGDEAFKDCRLMQVFETYTAMPPAFGSGVFDGAGLLKHIVVTTPSQHQSADGWDAYASLMTSTPVNGEEFFWTNQTTTGLYQVTTPATYSNSYAGEAKVVPYSAAINTLYPYTPKGTLIIPAEVSYIHSQYTITAIGTNAYKDRSLVNVVLIPEGVTSIDAGAFSGCTAVENVFFLWNDPSTVTWADANVGAEFATVAAGTTKIFVPKGKLAAYQTWAPAWASCMIEGEVLDVDATNGQDPDNHSRFYCTFYDSQNDYMLPPSVWAHVGYISGSDFILRPIAYDGDIIPAGTAVVLESETPDYRLIAVESASPSPARRAPAYEGPNDLQGLDNDKLVSVLAAERGITADKIYVLGNEAWVGGNRQLGMGMYQYTGSTLSAHKAFMIYSGSGSGSGSSNAPARFLFRHEDHATGVEDVQGNAQCTKVIRDGQLVIIKGGKEYNAQGQVIK